MKHKIKESQLNNHLDLSSQNLLDIAEFINKGNLSKLQVVNVSNNKLYDIDALRNLRVLQEVNASYNNIEKVSL